MQPTIPRAGGLPLFGALPRFLRDPLATLGHAQRMGDVCRLELGFIDAVTLHHPDHVDHVFRTHHRNYTKKGAFWASVRDLLGDGLPVSEGDVWRRHRRMMQPQFHRQRLQGLATLVIDALGDSLQWADVDSAWRTIDVGSRMPHLTMNVASAALLGLQTSHERAQLVGAEIASMQRDMFSTMVTRQVPRWVPMPGRRRFAQSVVTVRREVQRLIDERRRQTEPSDDLLGLLIGATDDEDGEGLTDAQLLDETMSLYLAGYETTSTSLQWALGLLGEHNDLWERLREECDVVLRGRDPRPSDLRKLSYARWVMQEAMRLHPPVWWLPRMAEEDDEIDGYAIPRGTMVAPIIYSVHRHPEFWTDPERFDPERFEPSRVAKRHPLAWCPFGAGPRKCIGQELSLMESTLALAMMTQRFELAGSGPRPKPDVKSTLRPAHGVHVRIRRRPARRRTVTMPMFSPSDSSSAMAM